MPWQPLWQPVLHAVYDHLSGILLRRGGRREDRADTYFHKCLFAFTLLLTPFALMIPSAATAPALIIIGVGMLSSMRNINYDDFTESFPAFICVAFTIFANNIANGICVALPVYVVLKLASGKIKEMPKIMYVLLGVCVLYFYSIIK